MCNIGECQLKMGYFVNFIKNPMVKAIIESKAAEESTNSAKVWVSEIKKYFANL